MFLKTLQMINADNFIIIEPTVPFGGGGGVFIVFCFCSLCVSSNDKCKNNLIVIIFAT